jgi:hypothetical protein
MCQIRSLSGEDGENKEFALKVSASMTEDVRQRTTRLDMYIKNTGITLKLQFGIKLADTYNPKEIS